jgi:hypothetical protein
MFAFIGDDKSFCLGAELNLMFLQEVLDRRPNFITMPY